MLMQRMFERPLRKRDRVTATEMIDGIECLVVLEQDMFGRYRETCISPLDEQESSDDEDILWPGFVHDVYPALEMEFVRMQRGERSRTGR